MKASDLRIGNYVYYEHTTHVVSGIHGNKVYSWWVKDGEPVIEWEAKDISGTQVEAPYMDVISQYEPIPLTEEWLIKLGFEHYHQTKYNIKNNNFEIDIWFDDNGTINDIQLSSTNISGAYPNIKNFQYLHQIQNLYFVLTGEELKLK